MLCVLKNDYVLQLYERILPLDCGQYDIHNVLTFSGALHNPKGILVNWYKPLWELISVFISSSDAIHSANSRYSRQVWRML